MNLTCEKSVNKLGEKMPIALYTIEEYIVKREKEILIGWFSNTVYNDIHAFKKRANGK